jgi:hypothetical protein
MPTLDHTSVRFDPPAPAERWPTVSRVALAFVVAWVPLTLLALLTGWRGSWGVPEETGPMLSDFVRYGSAVSGPLLPQLVLLAAAPLAARAGRIGAAATAVLGILGLVIAFNGVASALTHAEHAPQAATAVAGGIFAVFGVVLVASAWMRLTGRSTALRLLRGAGVVAVAIAVASTATAPPAAESSARSLAAKGKCKGKGQAKKGKKCKRKRTPPPGPQASPPSGQAPPPAPPPAPVVRATLNWSHIAGENADIDLVMFDEEGSTTFGDYADIPDTFHTGDAAGPTGQEQVLDRRSPSSRQFSYGVCAYEIEGHVPVVDFSVLLRRADGSTSTVRGRLNPRSAVEVVPPGGYEIDPDDDDAWCAG